MVATASAPATPAAESLAILMIDDEPELRNIYRQLLEMEGHRVLSAGNGAEGLKIAVREKPDLVICDLSMPDMDGMAVLRALRKSTEISATPFIFFTGNEDDVHVRREASKLGVSDFIAKPCPLVELREEIVSIARRFGLLQLNLTTLMNLSQGA